MRSMKQQTAATGRSLFLVKDDREKLHVFDNSGLYLATKKIGKNNPKAVQRLQNYKKVVTDRQEEQIDHNKNRGAR